MRAACRAPSWHAVLPWLGMLLAVAGCTDAGSPLEPTEPPGPQPIFLESTELLPGGHGVLVSAGFVEFDLIPMVGDDGAEIQDRWTNLRVTVGDEDVGSRRLDETRIEFDVPVLPATDVTVEVETPFAVSSGGARVRGLLSSARVDDCAAHDFTTLIGVDDEVVFSLYCPDPTGTGWRLGYAALRPSAEDGLRWLDGLYIDDDVTEEMRTAVVHPGPSTSAGRFVVRRPGPVSEPLDMWLWTADPFSEPVESRTCFPDGSGDDVQSAVADLDGSCLAFQAGIIRRDAQPISECCASDALATFVLSPDGSAALRHVMDLVVIDSRGRIVYRIPYGDIIEDVAFSRDGERVFVATGNAGSSAVDVRDRVTGELVDRLELAGRVTTLLVVGGRLWLTREPNDGGPFAVELYDTGTLRLQRRIALPRSSLAPPQDQLTGDLAVLQQNADGTRLYLTSRVGGIIRSDAFEVF